MAQTLGRYGRNHAVTYVAGAWAASGFRPCSHICCRSVGGVWLPTRPCAPRGSRRPQRFVVCRGLSGTMFMRLLVSEVDAGPQQVSYMSCACFSARTAVPFHGGLHVTVLCMPGCPCLCRREEEAMPSAKSAQDFADRMANFHGGGGSAKRRRRLTEKLVGMTSTASQVTAGSR